MLWSAVSDALDPTARALEKQATWNQGYSWDIPNAPLRRWLLVAIGIDKLLARLREGWQWCRYDLQPYAERARALAAQIKVALHFTIRESMSDTQVIHQLLSQLGIKLTMRWSRSFVGYAGQKLRTYTLDTEHWDKLTAVLERREAKRQRLQVKLDEGNGTGSPVGFGLVKDEGDPPASIDEWLSPEALADVQNLVLQAGGDPEVLSSLRLAIPAYVLKHLGVVG